MTTPIMTDRNMIRQVVFKYNVILRLHKKEPDLSIDSALWAAEKLWEKEEKDEKELIG